MDYIKVQGPSGCSSSLSWNGQTYNADADAIFTVPIDAYSNLVEAGFIAVGSAIDVADPSPAPVSTPAIADPGVQPAGQDFVAADATGPTSP